MLPFLLAGAVVACGGFGLKKGADGAIDSRRAGNVERQAAVRLAASKDRLNRAVSRCEASFGRLARQRARAREILVSQIVPTLRLVAGVEELGFADVEDAVREPESAIVALEGSQIPILEVGHGAYVGYGAGAALGAAAQSGVMSFGVASTGASISGLSGAAAANSTMAWFGGGSIASGGFGMAGGAAVLSGVAVAPAILLGGLAYARSADQRLTRATAFSEEVDVAVEEGGSAISRTDAVTLRVNELQRAISDVLRRADALSARIASAIQGAGGERLAFGSLPEALRREVVILGSLGSLLGELIQVDVADEAARLLEASTEALNRWRKTREMGA